MRSLFARILMPRASRIEAAKLRHAKPGPTKRAKEHARAIEKMREMRFEMGMEFR